MSFLAHARSSAKLNFFLLFTILTLVTPALATKPCPKAVCEGNKCTDSADWIAEGKIDQVTNALKGHPLNKNFASFVFTPYKWLKGDKKLSLIHI